LTPSERPLSRWTAFVAALLRVRPAIHYVTFLLLVMAVIASVGMLNGPGFWLAVANLLLFLVFAFLLFCFKQNPSQNSPEFVAFCFVASFAVNLLLFIAWIGSCVLFVYLISHPEVPHPWWFDFPVC
jgi:hypothetical protein